MLYACVHVWSCCGIHHAAEGVHHLRNFELLVAFEVEGLEYLPDPCEQLRDRVLAWAGSVCLALLVSCHLICRLMFKVPLEEAA